MVVLGIVYLSKGQGRCTPHYDVKESNFFLLSVKERLP